jgi:hypothetical protein
MSEYTAGMKSQVTRIIDRHEFTFVVFYRDHADLGRLYYRPSPASCRRLAHVLQRMHGENALAVYSADEFSGVYRYDILCSHTTAECCPALRRLMQESGE